MTSSKVRLIILWFLRGLVGLAFLGIGIEKIAGSMGTIPFFEAIGWGQWFRYASGAFDIAGVLSSSRARWAWLQSCASPCRDIVRFSLW
jgi:putative oxidoreductase